MRKSSSCSWLRILSYLLVVIVPSSVATAQTLRFSNHREVEPPKYATLHMFEPLYSDITFSQSAGYRYTSGKGAGVDFMFANQRGAIKEDGSEIPLVSTLDFRNYLLISRSCDLDFSIKTSYAYYPLKTQENEFLLDLAQEGIVGDFSMEFELTPFVKATLFENGIYRTDYIDTRGLKDTYGGQEYVHLENSLGLDLDWLMAKDQNMGISLSRKDVLPRDQKFVDQKRVSYNETVLYQNMINPLIVAGVSAVFSQDSYLAATNDRPDSASQQYNLFGTVRLTERSVGTASVGYSMGSVAGRNDGLGAGLSDQGSVVGGVSLSTKLDRGLDHVLSFTRSQTVGFNSAFEVNDTYGYQLNWQSDSLVSGKLFSNYSSVTPDDKRIGSYSDWESGISMSYPLYKDIVSLQLSSMYSIRDNSNQQDQQVTEVEWKNRYSTWVSQAGTSFLVIKNLLFSTYIQHVERKSDSSEMAYSRDTLAATFTYSHQF